MDRNTQTFGNFTSQNCAFRPHEDRYNTEPFSPPPDSPDALHIHRGLTYWSNGGGYMRFIRLIS